MELFTLFGKIAVNDKEATKSIDSVTGKAKQSEGIMSKAFSNIGKVIAGAFTVGAIVAFEKKIVSTYSTYDDQMRKVQAVSGATGKQFEMLRDKAEELGAKTRFSATEAGQGMENLARAGWKTGEIMEGIGPVLSFATANAIDLGSAAGIVSDGLSQFGLKAKDTTMFTDVLSATAAAANTDIGLLGETFKYVGPVAGSLGYELQDVSVAIGLMANKGIKGSQAGTTLRSAMTRLANPTGDSAKAMKQLGISLTDSTGKVKPFSTLMGELRGKFSKLSDAQKAQMASTIFGQEAMSGMLAIVNSSDAEFNKMTKAIAESNGQTQKMADTMDGGLGGAIANVQSAFEGLLIKLGGMQDGILVDGLNGLAKVMQDLPSKIESVGAKINEFKQFLKDNETTIKAVGIALGILGAGILAYNGKVIAATIVTKAISAAETVYIASMYAAEFATKAFGIALKFLTSPVGIVTIAIAAFAAAAYLIYKNWDKIGPWLTDMWNTIKATAETVWNAIKDTIETVVNAISTVISTVFESIKTVVTVIWEAIKTYITLHVMAIKFVIETVFTLLVTIIRVPLEVIKAIITTIWNYIGDYIKNALNTIQVVVTTIWNAIKTTTQTVWNAIKQVITTVWNGIKGVITTIIEGIKTIIITGWNIIKSITTTVWNAIKAVIVPIVNAIKSVITTVWNGIKSVTETVFNGIKLTITTIWNGIKSTISTVVNGIKTTITTVWNTIKSVTTTVWNGIKTVMVTPIEGAKNTISGIIDKIKGFFSGLKLKFPKIQMPKLPHFSLKGGFSLNPPSVPKLGVDWYSEGGIFTKPTVFGGIGVGDANHGHGSAMEAVLPISKLSSIMADTMKELGYDNKEKESDTPFIIKIENMNVRSESDIKAIAQELDFYKKQYSLAKGGSY